VAIGLAFFAAASFEPLTFLMLATLCIAGRAGSGLFAKRCWVRAMRATPARAAAIADERSQMQGRLATVLAWARPRSRQLSGRISSKIPTGAAKIMSRRGSSRDGCRARSFPYSPRYCWSRSPFQPRIWARDCGATVPACGASLPRAGECRYQRSRHPSGRPGLAAERSNLRRSGDASRSSPISWRRPRMRNCRRSGIAKMLDKARQFADTFRTS